MGRFFSLLAVALGAVAAFGMPIVAFRPQVGVNTIYRWRLIRSALAAAGVVLSLATCLRAPSRGRWATVPLTGLLAGLAWLFDPARVFAALDRPPHVPAVQAELGDDALVLGLAADQAACAWPLELVVPHHLVNDEVDGRPVLASY